MSREIRNSKALSRKRRSPKPAWACGFQNIATSCPSRWLISSNSESVRCLAHRFQLGPISTAKTLSGSIPAFGFFTTGVFGEVANGAFEFVPGQAVFDQGVVFAINFHRSQRDDLAAAGVDDPDVLAPEHARKNCAQALARLRGSHCLHARILLSPKRVAKRKNISQRQPFIIVPRATSPQISFAALCDEDAVNFASRRFHPLKRFVQAVRVRVGEWCAGEIWRRDGDGVDFGPSRQIGMALQCSRLPVIASKVSQIVAMSEADTTPRCGSEKKRLSMAVS